VEDNHRKSISVSHCCWLNCRLLVWLIRRLRDRLDSHRIYKFISDSHQTFRSTAAILSATHIPESRVAELCSKDKRIKRNELEKQSWRIAS